MALLSRPSWGSRLAVLMAAMVVGGAGWSAWEADPGAPGSSLPVVEAAPLAARPAVQAESIAMPAGSLPTRVVLASAGIDANITGVAAVDRDGKREWETAWRAAGHHIDSARPGQPGNMVLTGHVSVADRRNLAVFAGLGKAAPGDIVDVYSGDDVYRYKVTKVSVVSPTDLRVLRSDATAKVTLITCTPDLKKRLVVVGTLVPEV